MQAGQRAAAAAAAAGPAAEEVHAQAGAGVEPARKVRPAAGGEAAGPVGGRAAKPGPTAAQWPRAARHAAAS